MKVRLENLERVVNEERAIDSLRKELKKAFGSIVNVNGTLQEIAYNVNDRIAILELQGKKAPRVNVSKVVTFLEHNDHEVKQMAKSLVPANKKLNEDKTSNLEINVARGDDTRRYEVDLSEEWYRQKAADLVNDYAKMRLMDSGWQSRAVANFCNHTKATSGVVIDNDKLSEAVQNLLDERDEATAERDDSTSLRSAEAELTESNDLNESLLYDPVQRLEENYTAKAFIELFNVKARRTLNENLSFTSVPVSAKLPVERSIKNLDERVVDKFVNAWNRQREMRNEPYRLNWSWKNERDVEFNVRKK